MAILAAAVKTGESTWSGRDEALDAAARSGPPLVLGAVTTSRVSAIMACEALGPVPCLWQPLAPRVPTKGGAPDVP